MYTKRLSANHILVAALLLAVIMVICWFNADTAFAAGPSSEGELIVTKSFDGREYYLYGEDQTISTVSGFTYSKSTNTLTIKNANYEDGSIEASDMGSDFKIKISGSNTIATIVVDAYDTPASLTIKGTGSLDLNPNFEYNTPLCVVDQYEGNKNTGKLVIENGPKLYMNIEEGNELIQYETSRNVKTTSVISIKGKCSPKVRYKKVNNGDGYYYQVVNTYLTVTPKPRIKLKSSYITVKSCTYSGKAKKPAVTVKYKKKTLKEGTDYKVTYSNNINAGKKAIAKVTGIGKYKGTVSKRFTIKKCGMGKEYISATLEKTSYPYTGKAIKPKITVYFKNKTKLKKGIDYTVSYLDNKKIGKAYVMVTGKGNFKPTGRLFAFKITKAKQPIKLSVGSICKRYRDIGTTGTVSVTGIKERAKLSVSSSNKSVATVKKSDGKYKITYKGVGTAKIYFKTTEATKHYKKTTKTLTVTVVDDRLKATIKMPKTKYTFDVKDGGFDLKATTDSDGKLTYSSSDTSVITVDQTGHATITGKEGEAVITVTSKGTTKYKPATQKVTVTVVERKLGEDVVKYAEGLLGKEYELNTHGPETFDCSGFVYYVYKQFGITLSTGSSDYWNHPEQFGTVVSEADAMPGDVVSWEGHVGIYVSKDKMINALGEDFGVCYTQISLYTNSQKVVNPPHKYIRIKSE